MIREHEWCATLLKRGPSARCREKGGGRKPLDIGGGRAHQESSSTLHLNNEKMPGKMRAGNRLNIKKPLHSCVGS